mgnify:CR=1 FL=1
MAYDYPPLGNAVLKESKIPNLMNKNKLLFTRTIVASQNLGIKNRHLRP